LSSCAPLSSLLALHCTLHTHSLVLFTHSLILSTHTLSYSPHTHYRTLQTHSINTMYYPL
jgi:hypothetical protein